MLSSRSLVDNMHEARLGCESPGTWRRNLLELRDEAPVPVVHACPFTRHTSERPRLSRRRAPDRPSTVMRPNHRTPWAGSSMASRHRRQLLELFACAAAHSRTRSTRRFTVAASRRGSFPVPARSRIERRAWGHITPASSHSKSRLPEKYGCRPWLAGAERIEELQLKYRQNEGGATGRLY